MARRAAVSGWSGRRLVKVKRFLFTLASSYSRIGASDKTRSFQVHLPHFPRSRSPGEGDDLSGDLASNSLCNDKMS